MKVSEIKFDGTAYATRRGLQVTPIEHGWHKRDWYSSLSQDQTFTVERADGKEFTFKSSMLRPWRPNRGEAKGLLVKVYDKSYTVIQPSQISSTWADYLAEREREKVRWAIARENDKSEYENWLVRLADVFGAGQEHNYKWASDYLYEGARMVRLDPHDYVRLIEEAYRQGRESA